jgi:predicted PhzF superfamily epimerase YddE/YHI9
MCPLIYHVNAFCGVAAAGNPGAVCLLDDVRPSEWMQMIADQMNLSQTGFVRQLGPAEFTLRWFSPTHEVPLCAAETDVLSVQPNFGLLRQLADRGVILTARSDDPGRDIVSRYFASYVGVDEDPATGSAHCCLVPYWSEILGKPVIRARQASRRGGEISGRVDGDRVLLTGRARTVLSGRLLM